MFSNGTSGFRGGSENQEPDMADLLMQMHNELNKLKCLVPSLTTKQTNEFIKNWMNKHRVTISTY